MPMEVRVTLNNTNSSPKTKTIILHIGVPKTGSTSIQETLYYPKNRELLANKGYFYPKSWFSNHSPQLVSSFCEDPFHLRANIAHGFSKDQILEINRINIELLEKELIENKLDQIIISAEVISGMKKNELMSIKQFLIEKVGYSKHKTIKVQFRIIMYVRDPYEHTSSQVQQMIKNGRNFREAYNIISKSRKAYYQKRIRSFQDIFEKNAIQLYKFEEAIQHKYSIAGHFLSLLGFSEDDLREFKFIHANQRISEKAAEIISYINEQKPLLRKRKLNPGRMWGDTTPLNQLKGTNFNLTKEQKEELWSKSQLDLLLVAKEFGIEYLKVENPEKKESSTTPNNLKSLYTKEDCQFICEVLKKLSPTVRALTINFFEQHLNSSRFEEMKKATFVSKLYQAEKALKKVEKKIKTRGKVKQTIFNQITDYLLILCSGLFDKADYYSNYPDVKASRKNPIIHYIRHGAAELRNPSKEFNTKSYVNNNRDVSASAMNPFVHYIRFGRYEGRNPK